MSTLAVSLMPRPVFCVIDHLYRDLRVADGVRRGVFTHGGIPLQLGVEPDWLGANLPDDPEWRIEWCKFYYGLDLAHAFATTGDTVYLETWQRLIDSWIRQVPPDADRSDVIARRVLNWIYAWQRFAAAQTFQGLPAGADARILESIARQLSHVLANLTAERNHRTFELYALLVACLALPELDLPRGTLDFAVAELHQNLLDDIRPDGVHREASTHYHHVALRTYLGAYENARRFSVRLPSGYRERLERACEFAMHCHRPDGFIPALSDSDTGSYLDLLDLAGTLLTRPDFLYVSSGGKQGPPPTQRHASFSDGGYHTQRSGWGSENETFEDARYLVFDCGPLGDGGHGHYDLLSVEIAAHGASLLIDPGRYVYSEEGSNWRRWFKSTAAHNTVTVDGLDQTPYRRGAPRGPVAEGRLLQRLTQPELDVLRGEARSPAYDAVHQRRIVFVAGEYWLIEDRLIGEQEHTFDLRWHLSPAAMERTVLLSTDSRHLARAPGLALVIDGGDTAALEDGWYAPTYGHKLAAPVVSVRARGVREATFLTLIAPMRSGDAVPTMRIARTATTTSVHIERPTQRDHITWTAETAGVRMHHV